MICMKNYILRICGFAYTANKYNFFSQSKCINMVVQLKNIVRDYALLAFHVGRFGCEYFVGIGALCIFTWHCFVPFLIITAAKDEEQNSAKEINARSDGKHVKPIRARILVNNDVVVNIILDFRDKNQNILTLSWVKYATTNGERNPLLAASVFAIATIDAAIVGAKSWILPNPTCDPAPLQNIDITISTVHKYGCSALTNGMPSRKQPEKT